MSGHQSHLSDPDEEVVKLSTDMEALKIRESCPRLELNKQIRSLRQEIRRFQQMSGLDVTKNYISANGEQSRGKLQMFEPVENCTEKNLVDAVKKIEDHINIIEQVSKEMPDEDSEVLILLTDIETKRSLMNYLSGKMRSFLDSRKLTKECSEAPRTSSIPILPPLPDLDITKKNTHVQPKTEGSSSDSDTRSSSCSELEEFEDLYSLGGPHWEALNVAIKTLATKEEEEDLMMEASVLLGSDQKSKSIIDIFDESGQQVGTSREFLLKLPLLYIYSETKCPICRTSLSSNYRSARLPCWHSFHVDCILRWLLKKTTCPLCRREFPSS